MWLSIYIFSFLLLVNPQAALAEEQVRVRLFERYDRLVINGEIRVNGEKPWLGSRIVFENEGSNYTWALETASGRVVGLVDFSNPVEISGRNLTYGDYKLPSSLRVLAVQQPNGKFSRFIILGILGLEDYLAGVLPHEMPLAWPLEALKAQLVTARTYTLKQMAQRREEKYDVDSTVRDQLFIYDAPMTDERRKNLSSALSLTKGLVLVDEKGDVILANYHADCGGQTELPKNVWSYGNRGVAVNDSGCALRLTGTWTYSISNQTFLGKLRSELGVTFISQVASVKPMSVTDGGRINLLEIKLANGQRFEILATRMRELLGNFQFKSTRFETKILNGNLIFTGRGYGHGVGFCQWGAKDLAAKGRSYKEILTHYFPQFKVARR